jgi:hypothetical protein
MCVWLGTRCMIENNNILCTMSLYLSKLIIIFMIVRCCWLVDWMWLVGKTYKKVMTNSANSRMISFRGSRVSRYRGSRKLCMIQDQSFWKITLKVESAGTMDNSAEESLQFVRKYLFNKLSVLSFVGRYLIGTGWRKVLKALKTCFGRTNGFLTSFGLYQE